MRPSSKTVFLLLALIMIAGIALRLHLLGARDFWIDEAASWEFARLGWGNFWKVMWQYEANMVFYYVLLRVWLYLGDSEWMIRSLSVIFGVATILAVYHLGVCLFGRKAGVISAALLAVHTFHIRYSQEARSYSLLVLLLVLSTYFFCRAIESPRGKKYWAAYVIISALAIYAHTLAAFALMAQWLSLGFARSRSVGPSAVLGTLGALALLVAPMAAFLMLQNKGQVDWIPQPTLQSFFEFIHFLTGEGGRVLIIMYAAFCFLSLLPLTRQDPATLIMSSERWHVRLVTLWLVLPILATLGVSLIKPLFFLRYMIMCVPAVVLLAGHGITKLNRISPRLKPVLPLAVILMIALSMRGFYGLHRNLATGEKLWRGVAQYVLARQQPGDGAFFYIAGGHLSFTYYAHQAAKKNGYAFSPVIVFPNFGELPTGYNFDPTKDEVESAIRDRERIWLVAYTSLEDDGLSLIQYTLREKFKLQEDQKFGKRKENMAVQLYVRSLNEQENR